MTSFSRHTFLWMVSALIVLLLGMGIVHAESTTGSTQENAASPSLPFGDERADESSLLNEARLMIDAGEWTGARERYQSYLTLPDAPTAVKDEVRKALDKLNIQILFSPTQTEDSVIYVVQKGDNLHDIAKKHGTTVALITKSNYLSSDLIRPGQTLKISTAKYSVQVNRSENVLRLLSNDEPFKQYLVGTGADDSTPLGTFTIVNKLEDPTWYNAGAVVPPDSPDNILGTRWMGFSLAGYGIHGTTLPESIGKHESRGCIRMHNEDVEELYTILTLGTKVIVKA